MKVYIAADHAGFALKGVLITYIEGLGYDVEDCGAFTLDQGDDYPDFVKAAAKKLSDDVSAGDAQNRAIVLGASGQGEAIVANRFNGVRAALYYGKAATEQTDMTGVKLDMVASTRFHNDVNALSLGARFISQEEAKRAVREFLETPFSKEARHIRRIKKIEIN